jgi:hypothetical protein
MTVKQGHPRIWLDAERLNWLRGNPTRLEWTRLLTNCQDGFKRFAAGLPLTKPDSGLPCHYDSPLNYALVYAVTGSQQHAEMAKRLVEIYLSLGVYDAMTRVGATSAHGFGARVVIPEVAVTYDWLWPALNGIEKTRWAGFAMDCADWCWLETNPTKGVPPLKYPDTWSQSNPGDNFYLGFLMSFLAALALSGEHPKAPVHLALGLEKLAGLRAYLENYARGGFSLEGTAYGNWIRHGYLIAAMQTATDNPWAGFDQTFLADVARSRWQITAPSRKHLAPLGGQPSDRSAPIIEDHAGAPLVALSHGDGPTKALAKSWLDGVTYTRKRQNSWMAALWYDNRVKAASVAGLPTAYRAEGAGYVSYRTNWDGNPAWVIFQCGPVRESHQSYAAGEVALQANGEWLTGPARLWATGSELLPSEYNNVILVGGKGQPGQVGSQALPKDSMQILSFNNREVSAEAGRAYDYYRSGKVWEVLNGWRRTVNFDGQRLTVKDEVTKVDPAEEVVAQFHCQKQPLIAAIAGAFTLQGAKGQLAGMAQAKDEKGSLLPIKLAVRPINKGPKATLSSYSLDLRVPGGTKVVTISTTMEIRALSLTAGECEEG